MSSLYTLGIDGVNEPEDYEDHMSDEEYFSGKLYNFIENDIYETIQDSLPETYSVESPEYIKEEKDLFNAYLNSLALLKQEIEKKIKN